MTQGILIFGMMGIVVHLLSHHCYLWWRSQHLEKQLRIYQNLMDQAFTEIHNGPIQLLIVLMREMQMHEVPKSDLLQQLSVVYKEVLSGVQKLQEIPETPIKDQIN